MKLIKLYENIVDEATDELSVAITEQQADDVRVKYLGKHGIIVTKLLGLGDLRPDIRPIIGQQLHNTKDAIVKAIDNRKRIIRIVERAHV